MDRNGGENRKPHPEENLTGDLGIRKHARRQETRQLYLAVDVSSSMRRMLSHVRDQIVGSLSLIQNEAPFELALYLFNRNVIPYPNRDRCRPRVYQPGNLPSLDEMRECVKGGTALLDAFETVLDDASRSTAVDKRVIILTDGWERSSRRATYHSVRRQIESTRRDIDVSLLGFVDGRTSPFLMTLVSQLGLPENAYSIFEHDGDDDSVLDSIISTSKELVKKGVSARM